jgi:hypothetical protein
MIDPGTGGLFGGHVFGGADDVAMGRVGGAAEQLRDPEIGELHPLADRHVVGEQDVRGLEVAMDDAVIVRDLERPGDRKRRRHGLLPGEPAPAAERLLDRLAADQLHGEVGLIPLLPVGEELDDARMTQLLERLDLVAEARLQAGVVGEVGREDLDGHRRAGGRVDGFVDGPHAATTEPGADGVWAELCWFHRGVLRGDGGDLGRRGAVAVADLAVHCRSIGYNCRTGSFCRAGVPSSNSTHP